MNDETSFLNDDGNIKKLRVIDNGDGTYSTSVNQSMTGLLSNDYRALGDLSAFKNASLLGYLQDVKSIDKFSRADLSNNTLQHLGSFPNTNPFLDASTNIYLTSSSALDNQNILIKYIDLNYNMQEVTKTLNGYSSVLIANNIHCIWEMENQSSSVLNGEVYASSELNPALGVPLNNGASNSTVYCHIPITSGISANQSTTSIFTVPVGYSALISNPILDTQKGTDCLSAGFLRQYGQGFKYKLGMASYANNTQHTGFTTLAPEKSDLKMLAIAQTGGICYFTYHILLIKNTLLGNN